MKLRNGVLCRPSWKLLSQHAGGFASRKYLVPADEFEQSCNMWTESSDASTFSAEGLTRLQAGIGQQLRAAQDADQPQSEPEGLAEPYPPTGRPCSSNVKWKSIFHAAKRRQHENAPALPDNTFFGRHYEVADLVKSYCSPLQGRVCAEWQNTPPPP